MAKPGNFRVCACFSSINHYGGYAGGHFGCWHMTHFRSADLRLGKVVSAPGAGSEASGRSLAGSSGDPEAWVMGRGRPSGRAAGV